MDAIHTARVDLLPLTLDACEAILAGDHERAAQLLGADLGDWPDEAERVAAFPWYVESLRRDPSLVVWLGRAIVLRDRRLVIGSVNLKGVPTAEGRVELGYGLVEAHRGHGYAQEAVATLLAHLFADPSVREVVAEIDPANTPSVRLAAAVGFAATGAPSAQHAGHQIWLLTRDTCAAPLTPSPLAGGVTYLTQQLDQAQTLLTTGRVVSLWDIMRPFDAGGFLATMQMLELLGSGSELTRFTSENQRSLAEHLASFEQDCVELGLTGTAVSVRRLTARLAAGSGTKPSILSRLSPDLRLHKATEEVLSRLRDETTGRLFLSLSGEEAKYYNRWAAGWEETLERFPSAFADVEEASKCLALGRSSACVFHCMRVMEYALYSLGATLNDPALQNIQGRNWDDVLNKCRSQLNKNIKDREPEWAADPEFFADAMSRLIAVKEAWRNPTMHVRASGYSEEQAGEILFSVRSFMRHIATKLAQ